MSITTTQKIGITIEIENQKGQVIDNTLTCTTTADFRCEVLWLIPKDTIPGTYTITVNNGINTEQTTFEIK